MNIKVVRSVFTPTATLGKMFIDDTFFAFTLEDTVRNMNGDCSKKVQNKTAIDMGTYEVALSFSNRFKRIMPLLLKVPCFEAIRIHGGNTSEDTEGCILIGAESNMTDRIWNCAGKVNDIIQKLTTATASGKVFIEIVNE